MENKNNLLHKFPIKQVTLTNKAWSSNSGILAYFQKIKKTCVHNLDQESEAFTASPLLIIYYAIKNMGYII